MEAQSLILPRTRLFHPYQVAKNLFVFVGIVFSEQYTNTSLLFQATITFFSFVFASSAVQLLNTGKRLQTISALLIILSFTCAFAISYPVVLFVTCYLGLSFLYLRNLKSIPILNIFAISGCFLCRIFAGTYGLAIPSSNWLFICGLTLTLFLALARRYPQAHSEAEKLLHESLLTICAATTILSYSLYAMSRPADILIFTVPWVIYATFRYLHLLYHYQKKEDPTPEILKDPHFAIAIGGWGLHTCGIFLFY